MWVENIVASAVITPLPSLPIIYAGYIVNVYIIYRVYIYY